jgi:amino acid adenylation domain-containing protein
METSHPQRAVRTKDFHPSDSFTQFSKEEVEQSIPSRFEKIVSKYSDRIALKTDTHILTYAELNAMANGLGRAILTRKAGKARPVGLLFEKGTQLIAAMLGVLKAGKFFVLLDPSFPKARITAMFQDSNADLLISARKDSPLAMEVASDECRLMEFESTQDDISAENLRLVVSPKALAVIFYTSGSTGKPKGVVQNHRNLLHNMMLRTNASHVCEHDRITLLPSGTANSVTNSFLALLNGAALLPYNVQKEGVAGLASWLSQERITICLISSALFRNLCETQRTSERFPDLRVIRLRSEAVCATDVELFKKHFPSSCILANGLSSSETGPLSEYIINHSTDIAGGEVPLGYAVEDKELLLLDEQGKPIGFNEVGEITVKSSYLSGGYWRKPDLTKTKFKRDPNGGKGRFYLTGDLGLFRSDGCLVYKGRKDFRVKVRGYGVEIAEVEKALRGHAAVRELVVVVRENESGEARLIAYFTPFDSAGPSVTELRSFLHQQLPEYMIPSTFVMLNAIPLTPNGKVDRNALPTPNSSRPELATQYVAPVTTAEKRLAQIWAEILGLDEVGTHDNFFDLGGHSLLATRLLSRIHDDFEAELPLGDFFKTPTIAALAERIEQARHDKQSLQALPISRVSRDGNLALSFAQERLWFLEQLEPGNSAYNMFSAHRFTGQLDVQALELSFNEMIRRHESWRTVFEAEDGQPKQLVLPSLMLKVPVVDLRVMVSDAEREREVRRLFRGEAQKPFDLARGPLLRVILLRLTEDEHILLLARHHIIYDGWCRGIMARELSILYDALSRGHSPSLPGLPVQYADFAQWQRQWLQGEVLERQLAYWRKRLDHAPTLQLPTDRPRPPVQTSRGARHYFAFSETLSSGLKSLSHRHGLTLFMTLLAAFQTLLHRYTGQNDIVIGAPIAGRNRSELEGLIGLFLNVLVLRTDLSGDPTFQELLLKVRDICVGAYAHQDLPFEKLVEELRPERNLSHHPLFQVTFSLQNTPRFPLELTGLTVDDLEVDAEIARFDLELFIEEGERGLRGYMNYNTDLFSLITIERMVNHFETLLQRIVVNSEQRLSDLPILTEPETQELLVKWNNTQTDYPRDKCVHELFEEQVERSPDAVAVVFENQQLTYRELNERANQLARHLRKLGAGRETLVGICMERSLEMVVGLLGILKAGAAYVPLNPSYPNERLAFMLQDTRAHVLLTQQRLLEGLPSCEARRICVDTDSEDIKKQSRENPVGHTTAENLAYVIHTSGSTGKPKGVQIPHRAMVNFLSSMRQKPGLTERDVLLAVTNLSFDIAALEIFLPLTVGGRMVMISGEVATDARQLSEKMSSEHITVMQATPATWHLLSGTGWQGSKDLKILCGGEALSPELATKLLPKSSSLWNLYGPTETTIWSAFHQVQSGDGPIPIGRPITNTQIYLLDSYLQPVPIGVAGELHIGGLGLARGYLNLPHLTAEKFIPNPFSAEPGARLYRTGDLARYLADGNIEFLGRVDNQVKIRGFRIELGEIETVLAQIPGVREAVVVVREDEAEKRLVAYLVPNQDSIPTIAELRSFLKSKLPDYMIPSAFVFLDAFSLTPNGKVDRRALPPPDKTRPDLEEAFVAPRTPLESEIARIWGEILKLERVGIHDNFFDLGGHSLLATRLLSRVGKAVDLDVPLRSLFENPTVAALAAEIAQTQAKDSAPKIAELLADLEYLSEEEAQRLVAEQDSKNT